VPETHVTPISKPPLLLIISPSSRFNYWSEFSSNFLDCSFGKKKTWKIAKKRNYCLLLILVIGKLEDKRNRKQRKNRSRTKPKWRDTFLFNYVSLGYSDQYMSIDFDL